MEKDNTIRKALFFGDSNTFGYDPAGYMGGRYPREKRWTTILQEKLKDSYELIVDGMNGRQIPDMSRMLATSWGWMPSTLNATAPTWRLPSAGPMILM